DETGDASQGQRVADRLTEEHDRRIGQQAGNREVGNSDETKPAVVDERVDDNRDQADGVGEQTRVQLVTTECRGYGNDVLLLELNRQRAVLQHVGKVVGGVLREVAGDRCRAADDAVGIVDV